MVFKQAGVSRLMYRRHWLHVVGICLLISLPIFLYGIPNGVDLPHHYRLAQGFYDSIVNGDFYPSWLSSTNGGYGDPSVRFYPPGLYFLLSFFRLITRDWFVASQLALSLLSVIGGLGMYLWARALTRPSYAVLASALYLLSPFHATEIYQSGMLAQYACASVLPFVFAFTERVMASGRWRDVGGLGLSYGFLILFHLPLALLGSIAIGIYALVRLLQSFNKRRTYQLISGALFGLALSCFYWLPMLLELKWKSPSGSDQGAWFNYQNNFIFRASPNEMGNWWLPYLTIFTLLMALPAVVLFAKRNRRAPAPAIIALLSFLMATPLSKPVWDALPSLQETQFPWRWLTITSACLSLLVTVSLPALVRMWRTRLRPLTFALFGISLIAVSFTLMQVVKGARFQNRADFNRVVAALQGSETNRDFLPLWVGGKPQAMDQPVEGSGRDVQVIGWSGSERTFQVEAGDQTDFRLKTFYYPHWKATADGRQLATRPAEDGALMVSIPTTTTTVNVEFVEPASSYIAGAISLLGLLVIMLALGNILPIRMRSKINE
jgi:uncharacterized membrane protein